MQCQNERSQHKNRSTAMKMLKARLYEMEKDRLTEDAESRAGEKRDVAWGSQIRSYVFHPYKMVKDLRTGFETGNVESVMDGNLDGFVEAYLKSLAGIWEKRGQYRRRGIATDSRGPGGLFATDYTDVTDLQRQGNVCLMPSAARPYRTLCFKPMGCQFQIRNWPRLTRKTNPKKHP